MNRFIPILILVLLFLLSITPRSHSATNSFFFDWGPDKTLHLIMGTIVGFNYCLLPFDRPEDAYMTAILIDVGITFGKELYDSFTGGTVEIADIGAGLLPAVLITSGLFALENYAGIRLRIGFGQKEVKLSADRAF